MSGLLLVTCIPLSSTASAESTPSQDVRRELVVPFDDLNLLLESGPRRVLLPQAEFEALRKEADQQEEERPTQSALLTDAEYSILVEEERALITGTLHASVLQEGLHAIPFDMGGIGLQRLDRDGEPAALGRGSNGGTVLFLRDPGDVELTLKATAPLQTSAARQVLQFQLPTPGASRLYLTVPGDVELRSGAAVLERVFNQTANQTGFYLLASRGHVNLVMSLNSRLKRRDRVVVARSVMVDEITRAHESLRATVSLEVLHQPLDQFSFQVPEGFDITAVQTEALARWVLRDGDAGRMLEVELREEVSDTVVIRIDGSRPSPDFANWTFPRLEPVDVVGHVSVVGVAADQRLSLRSVKTDALIPVDLDVLSQAAPAPRMEDASQVPVRPVAAYYAPQSECVFAATFYTRPPRILVSTHTGLQIDDQGLTATGGFSVRPVEEDLFAVDILVPAEWDLVSLTAGDTVTSAYERYAQDDGSTRVNLRLPAKVAPGSEAIILFEAQRVPSGWLEDWKTTEVSVPVFRLLHADRDIGAITVDAPHHVVVRPRDIQHLNPLDAGQRALFGITGDISGLAFRYDEQPYRAVLDVHRLAPRMTAEAFSFFRAERDALHVHHELVYELEQARTRDVHFSLLADTPSSISIVGLGDTTVKEYVPSEQDGRRTWTVRLAEEHAGRIHIAVSYPFPVSLDETGEHTLPLPRVEQVVFQSGLLAVEGNPELDIRVMEHPRRVDVGELVDADFQPGKRLLGAFAYVGEPVPVRLSIARRPQFGLPAALVERAAITTSVSRRGVAQSLAWFRLHYRVPFLEIALPDDATLWSVVLDDVPLLPQQDGDRILVSLPATSGREASDLVVAYETPSKRFGSKGRVRVKAPRLALPTGEGEISRDVEVGNLQWRMSIPNGYRIQRTGGTLTPAQTTIPQPAARQAAGWLYHLAGGIQPSRGLVGFVLMPIASSTQDTLYQGKMETIANNGKNIYLSLFARSLENPLDPNDYYNEATTADIEFESVDEDQALGPFNAPGQLLHERPPAQAGDRIRVSFDDGFGEEPVDQGEAAASSVRGLAGGGIDEDSREFIQMGIQKSMLKSTQQMRRASIQGILSKMRSLPIAMDTLGADSGYYSLGVAPTLDVTLVHQRRHRAWLWAAGLAVFVGGVRQISAPRRAKAAYIVGALVVSTLLAGMPGLLRIAPMCNAAFYAACLLIVFHLAVAVARWFARLGKRIAGKLLPIEGVTLLVLLGVGMGLCGTGSVRAGESDDPQPIPVPEDAWVVPYQADGDGIEIPGNVLVPYDRYRELWDKAHPAEPLEVKRPLVPYAPAGAVYEARLVEDDVLTLTGHLVFDVYEQKGVEIPLTVEGAVFTEATVDGRPALIRMQQAVPEQGQNMQQAGQQYQQPETRAPAQATVLINGKGRHRLDIGLLVRLDRQGGWRLARATLPHAPAASLHLHVPNAATEVLLQGVRDQGRFLTDAPEETIDTVLGDSGRMALQWRSKVTEGAVDADLTAEIFAVFDVQEDHLRLHWDATVHFRSGERDRFEFALPDEYLVEKVEGENIRGWAQEENDGSRRLVVQLLKSAKEQERILLQLQRTGTGIDPDQIVEVPTVPLPEAIRHSGRLVIRRSPLLTLRVNRADNVRRINLSDTDREAVQAAALPESPLGIDPVQAYDFALADYGLAYDVSALATEMEAEFRTILRLAPRDRMLESKVDVHATEHPIYALRIEIPAELDLERVTAPGTYEWNTIDTDGTRHLAIRFAGGMQGTIPILLRGKLGETALLNQVPIPRLQIEGVARQTGQIAVQADPSFEIQLNGLRNLERIVLERTYSWLKDSQRKRTQLALRYRDPAIAGLATLEPRDSLANVYTVTNVRVTDRTIEETHILHYTIRQTGIRTLAFSLPAYLADARILVPHLRQKTIEPAENGETVRVTLTLQDPVMNQLVVLVEQDRVLSTDEQILRPPTPETGRIDAQYLAVESAGRDEVVVEGTGGVSPLGRRQKEWERVTSLFKGGNTQAFLVSPDREDPKLVFTTRERQRVETAGARIGFARTTLFVDPNGTFRGRQIFHLDNRTEQFLEVSIPKRSSLWTVRVAGANVKPIAPDASKPNTLHIPLIKTEAGDLDYEVELKYGGTMRRAGVLRASRFPFIQVENVAVELSQVELHVPNTHRWFRFSGTLSQSGEEGDFEAGFLSYQNQLMKRMSQSLQFGSVFEKARAVSNLSELSGRQSSYNNDVKKKFSANEKINSQIDESRKLVAHTQEQLKRAEAAAAEEVNFDNRALLLNTFTGQTNDWSVDQDGDGLPNWEVTQQVQTTAGKPVLYTSNFRNAGWFAGNSLAPADTPDSGEKILNETQQTTPLADTNLRYVQQADSEELQSQLARLGKQASKGKAGKAPPVQTRQNRGRRSQTELAQRYQVKLQEQAPQLGQDFGFSVQQGQVDSGPFELDARLDEMAEPTEPGYTGQFWGGRMDAAGSPAAGLGLASLDIALPTPDLSRWQEFRFTTPRGALELSAAAISSRTIEGWRRFGVSVVAILVTWLIWRSVSGHGLRATRQVSACNLVIILAVIGLLLGIFPFAAALAAIAGFFFRRRAKHTAFADAAG